MDFLDEQFTLKDAEISILITDGEEMRMLNKKYRGIDEPTDVLSFSMREGKNNLFYGLLGDIVICWERAKKNAREMKVSLKEELATLLVHGFLHLMGYKDDDKKSLRKMKKKREKLLLMLKEKNYV
jgi:probable rRNA maturation factor